MNRAPEPEARRAWPWLLPVLALTAAVYAPAAWNDFVYDDQQYVKAETKLGPNVLVREVRPIAEYFRRPYGYPLSEHGRGFRPITVLTFALTHAAFSEERAPGRSTDPAWPHHVLNILLHALAAGLTYRMVARLTGRGTAALLAALVFGLHALRSDTVISIVGRGELLGFVFGAAGLLLFVGGLAGPRPVLWKLAASALSLFLAFCSKENAVVWAVFIPVYTVVALRRSSHPDRGAVGIALRRQVLAALLVIGPPLALFLFLRHQMLLEHGQSFSVTYNANPLYHAGVTTRMLTGTMLLAYGLWKVVAPFHLSADYGVYVFRLVESWTDPRFWGGLALLLLVLVGGLAAFRRQGLLFLAVTVFLGFALLTSNIVYPIETIFAERLYFTPALALSFVVAWLATRVPPGRPRGVLGVLVALWLAVGAALCVKRCFDWRSNQTLFVADAATQPRSLFLNVEAAGIYQARGDLVNRDRHLDRAARLDPTSPWVAITFGKVRLMEGKLEEARRFFGQAVASPRLEAGEKRYLHQNLGAILKRLGRRDEARRHFKAALEGAPGSIAAHHARIALLWLAYEDGDDPEIARRLGEGRRRLEEAGASRDREIVEASYTLFEGLLDYRRGRYPEALDRLGRSLSILETRELNPERIPAVLAYIDVLARTGHSDGARKMVEGYLRAPALPAERRPEFEALRRRLEGGR